VQTHLDAAFSLPQYADGRLISLLWLARLLVLNDKQLAKCSVPPCEGGDWCLDVGLALRSNDGLLAKHCSNERWQSSYGLRLHFAQKHYEYGLCRYRAFFNSGKGGYADAGLLGYSGTCNNLGVIYREQGQIKQARKLHQQGHACYPLALHQSNLFHCAHALTDPPALLLAAERLYYHVQEKGFEYHPYNLAHYAYDTARALHQQGRQQEVSLWLERLQDWEDRRQREQSEDSSIPQPCRGDYLHALMALLLFHSSNDQKQTRMLLRECLDEVKGLGLNPCGEQPLGLTLRYAATALENCCENQNDAVMAKELYLRAIQYLAGYQAIEIKRAKVGFARCDKASRRWKNA